MITDNWLAFPAGIMISTVVSAVGIGGGILWMPFFLIIQKLRPETAVLTSLLIQTAGKGSGAFAYVRQKTVDFRTALVLLGIAIPGITLGAYFSNILNSEHIEVILGLLVMTTAFLFVSSNEKYDDMGETRIPIRTTFRYSWITLIVSVGSGLLSTGIGEWLIPVMRSKMSLRMSNAIATCIFMTFGICVIGAIVHLIMGSAASYQTVMWGVPGVLIGGQIGPRITQNIDERKLKEVFIFLLTLIGIHLIYNSY